MSLPSFDKLCSLIKPHIDELNDGRLQRRYQRIGLEIRVACLIRWLAGGRFSEIRHFAGISRATFYWLCYEIIDAILACDDLAIQFPETAAEISESIQGFKNISTGGVVDGCVACLDGFLLLIQPPSPNETGNVMSYYSGHYAAYGINIQAACDSSCRFVYVALAAPGRTADVVALRKTSLSNMIERLPIGSYVIGDNAYVCSEHLLTPFAGEQRRDPKNDTYNFHISQLRIRIEMTFGRLVNRWRIFKKPLSVKLKNTGRVFMAGVRLHNFLENERLGMLERRGMPEEPEVIDDDVIQVQVPPVLGTSIMREILVEKIYHSGQSRPLRNIQRNG